MERKPGDKFGPYEIVFAIGKGGMGEVWKARDSRLNRDVAIKFCSNQFSDRFQREARAIAALNHPNICTLYDVGPDYLVMEYIEGAPPRGPLAPPEAVRLALGIAAALEAAHEKEITHRDLKPANILVTRSGVKLLDFGLALVNDNSAIGIADAPTALSVAGSVMGTVAYMSPEQAQGRPADARSDIFSFGLVLYEMLSGRQAFVRNSPAETMTAIIREEPAPLDAPAKLSEIVARCLRKAPASRFQTMNEVRSALEQVNTMPASEAPSVAVLPFANMSRDADDEYFSDGLAEEILNVLSHIPGLNVTARTSSFAFRGKEQDIRRIAEALGVRTILEGSVRRAGSRIRVTAQLINAADGYHLWSERFDRELTDVFAVQDEIATAIAGALQVKLIGKPATARPHEPNLPAYEAFLKGRHQFCKHSPEAYARAEEFFKQAIALDPQWADPHSALGAEYFYLGFFALRPRSEMAPLARAEARKALELFASEPMARAVLGIAASYDYDWEEAEEQFRLATASESFPPEVHEFYALFYLLPLGRFEGAIQEMAKAIARDPLNVRWRARRAWTLVCAEMYERAIVEASKALDFDDKSYTAHMMIALSYFFLGQLAEAREPAEEAVRIAPWDALAVGLLAGVLANAGEKERVEKLIATMSGAIPIGMMMYHLACSEIDNAVDWYQRDIESRQPSAPMIAHAGFLKPLRASPRWPKLAKMMNLPGTA